MTQSCGEKGHCTACLLSFPCGLEAVFTTTHCARPKHHGWVFDGHTKAAESASHATCAWAVTHTDQNVAVSTVDCNSQVGVSCTRHLSITHSQYAFSCLSHATGDPHNSFIHRHRSLLPSSVPIHNVTTSRPFRKVCLPAAATFCAPNPTS